MQEYSQIRLVSNLIDILVSKQVKQVVLSPGSRNAPFTIGFNQEPGIKCHSIVDERAAAYYALGISQATKEAIAICCTSGTAALNYYPAIAEAFYQEVPLIVITADRPSELIDQQHGQTIRQNHVFKNHCRFSVQLRWENGDSSIRRHNERLINQAINSSSHPHPGPVHINVPLREPLYDTHESSENAKNIKLLEVESFLSSKSWTELVSQWEEAKKILILPGMCSFDPLLNQSLNSLLRNGKVYILKENLANITLEAFGSNMGRLIGGLTERQWEKLAPDLVISFGQAIVNKRLKGFLKKFPPSNQWLIHPSAPYIDTYESLTHLIPLHPSGFLRELNDKIKFDSSSTYKKTWKNEENRINQKHINYCKNIPFSDLFVFKVLAEKIPENTIVHWGNSSPVRYAQFFGYNDNIQHWGNRGTSGIDGQISTAAGFASQIDEFVLCVTGDIAFFYDSNAFWNKKLPKNLRVLLINNGGGGIFRMINGPSQREELEEYFETHHTFEAQALVQTFGLLYEKIESPDTLVQALENLFQPSERAKILEVLTPRKRNSEVYKDYLSKLKSDTSY